MLLARRNNLDHPRLGLVIRKKFLRLAVDRNQLKRLARERFRLNQHEIANLDIVLMNRSGCEGKSKAQLSGCIERAFQKLPEKDGQ